MAPVAQGAHVAQVQAVLQAQGNAGNGAGDLAGYKGFAAHRAFVVEQDAVASVNAIGLAVVHRDPVSIQLGHRIGAAGVEGGAFLLRNLLHQAIQLAGAGLVKAGFLLQLQDPNRFENAQGTNAVGVGGVFGFFKAHAHMALGGQVVDLVGLHLLNDANQAGRVSQVAMVQDELAVFDVWVLVQVVNAVGVEKAAAALDAVHLVAFFKQQLGQVRAVLAGHAGDERHFAIGIALISHLVCSLRYLFDSKKTVPLPCTAVQCRLVSVDAQAAWTCSFD